MKMLEASQVVDFLSSKHPPREFLVDAPLVHRGHVPLAAYLVYDGMVLRGKSLRRMGQVPRGTILALDGILSKEPYDWHLHVKAGAQLSIMDFSALVSLHQNIKSGELDCPELNRELQRLFNMLPQV